MKTVKYGWTDEIKASANYINPAILKIVNRKQAKSILDAGCGNGALAAELYNEGFDVTGVDGDAEGISIARRMHSGPRFLVGLFEENPPGRFDLVCSTEVVEHLYAPHELARYCFEALRPGGTLVISTPYHGYLKNLALSVFDKWDYHLTANWHGGHIKFWSRRSLTELLEKAGFEVEQCIGVGRVPYLWKSMILVARRP